MYRPRNVNTKAQSDTSPEKKKSKQLAVAFFYKRLHLQGYHFLTEEDSSVITKKDRQFSLQWTKVSRDGSKKSILPSKKPSMMSSYEYAYACMPPQAPSSDRCRPKSKRNVDNMPLLIQPKLDMKIDVPVRPPENPKRKPHYCVREPVGQPSRLEKLSCWITVISYCLFVLVAMTLIYCAWITMFSFVTLLACLMYRNSFMDSCSRIPKIVFVVKHTMHASDEISSISDTTDM